MGSQIMYMSAYLINQICLFLYHCKFFSLCFAISLNQRYFFCHETTISMYFSTSFSSNLQQTTIMIIQYQCSIILKSFPLITWWNRLYRTWCSVRGDKLFTLLNMGMCYLCDGMCVPLRNDDTFPACLAWQKWKRHTAVYVSPFLNPPFLQLNLRPRGNNF